MIKSAKRLGAFEFSQHAVDQSILRHISVQELRDSIMVGKVIEDYPDDKYGPSCLILGFTTDGRPIHVQCSHPSRSLIKIVTLYEPDPSLWIDYEQGSDMPREMQEETFVEQEVTYTLEVQDRFIIIEHVPARVSLQTGERFFSPDTVEQLQTIVWDEKAPSRVIETPVFEFPRADT